MAPSTAARTATPDAAADEARSPSPSGRPLLDDFLLYLLARATVASTSGLAGPVRRRGFSIPEWRVMLTLADGPLTVGELAELMLMKQPTLTKILGRLEAAGMVRRQPDRKDRRRVRISLTPRGDGQLQEMVPQALAHEAALLADFTEAERDALKAGLRRLIDTAS